MSFTYTLRRTESRRLIPPSDAEIREAALAAGLRAWNPDYVRDLAELAAGGELKPPEDVERDLRSLVSATMRQDSDGDWVHPAVSGWEHERSKMETRAFAELARREAAIRAFTESIAPRLAEMRSLTPLNAAIAVLKAIAEQNPDGDGLSSGSLLPVFADVESAKDAADVISDVMETLDDLNQAGDGSGVLQPSDPLDVEAAELHLIANRLDEYVAFRAKTSKHLEEAPEGDDVIRRPLVKYRELARADKRLWAMPKRWRNYNILRRRVTVRARAIRAPKKQLLGVLVDASGSMRDGRRIRLAVGVLLNRLRAVAKGDAIVVYQFFDSSLLGESQMIETKAQAISAVDDVREHSYSGGGTAIEKCAKEFIERLANMPGDRPDVVVVTDGDDYVDGLALAEFAKQHDFVLHAIIVEGDNSGLAEAARMTGGIALEDFNGR